MGEYKLINRRDFLQHSAILGGSAMLATFTPFNIFARSSSQKIVILHTNDVHSRIEPFPMDGGKLQGRGGFSARASLVDAIRKEVGSENVMLFDAGDILQGTPYFNYFQGDIEFKLMSELKYDASAIGNHDFDGGIENLARLAKNADFPLLCANYDVQSSALNNLVLPFKIFNRGSLKVGVYALGIELNGLVPRKLTTGVEYLPPLEKAIYFEKLLHSHYGCHLIVCLSHLGFSYRNSKISDVVIAQSTSFTDVVVGGHTHTFMKKPEIINNKRGNYCYVFQTGWGGVNLGRLDFEFLKGKKKNLVLANSLSVS